MKRWLFSFSIPGYFNRRLPSETRVSSWITSQGWTANAPSVAAIIRGWKPSGTMDTIGESIPIRCLVKSQRWKGLIVMNADGKRRAVLAGRAFRLGEVVCDYHGMIVTGAGGQLKHATIVPEDAGSMFFYKDKDNQLMCINATVPCRCHPDMQTPGRLLNHSRKTANVRPRLYSMDIDGQQRDVVLFLAIRDICAGEELRFDSGEQGMGFCGE